MSDLLSCNKKYGLTWLFFPVVVAMAEGSDLNHMTFLGMIGMCDPPREAVADSVRQLTEGGVTVKMITGDAQETAESIG